MESIECRKIKNYVNDEERKKNSTLKDTIVVCINTLYIKSQWHNNKMNNSTGYNDLETRYQ